MFCNHKYSVFADLGDLSKYTFNELKLIANDFKTNTKIVDGILLTTWENNNSKFEILYTLPGLFIKIKSETWFNPNIHYERK